MTTAEKLVHFQEDAMMTARAESAKELDAYSENLNRIYTEHVKAARLQAQSHLRLAKESLRREHNRQLSRRQLETRRKLTMTMDEIIEDLFSRVRNMINTFKKEDAYLESLLENIQEAKKAAKGQELVIYIDKSDEKLLAQLTERTGLSILVSEEELVGGITALIPQKNMLIDLSYSSKIKEAKENLQLGGEEHV